MIMTSPRFHLDQHSERKCSTTAAKHNIATVIILFFFPLQIPPNVRWWGETDAHTRIYNSHPAKSGAKIVFFFTPLVVINLCVNRWPPQYNRILPLNPLLLDGPTDPSPLDDPVQENRWIIMINAILCMLMKIRSPIIWSTRGFVRFTRKTPFLASRWQ